VQCSGFASLTADFNMLGVMFSSGFAASLSSVTQFRATLSQLLVAFARLWNKRLDWKPYPVRDVAPHFIAPSYLPRA
jgi:hypothetical protein